MAAAAVVVLPAQNPDQCGEGEGKNFVQRKAQTHAASVIGANLFISAWLDNLHSAIAGQLHSLSLALHPGGGGNMFRVRHLLRCGMILLYALYATHDTLPDVLAACCELGSVLRAAECMSLLNSQGPRLLFVADCLLKNSDHNSNLLRVRMLPAK